MSRCGIFNQIKKKSGALNNSTIKVLDNTHTNYQFDNVYKTMDCDQAINSWVSNESYFIFKLIKRELKLDSFFYMRRDSSYYPTSLRIYGWNGVDWEAICTNSLSISSGGSQEVACKSNQYFSSFRFLQLANSNSASYIEFHKFELFGSLRTSLNDCLTCRRVRINKFSHSICMMIFLIKF